MVNSEKQIASPSVTEGYHMGQGGNIWGICPHTAHNSYILDIALAEELERVCAGSDISARKKTFHKVRERVREEFSEDAQHWILSQSQEVQNSTISVFHRKRPRGDFKNLKMTGVAGSSPKEWIKGIIGFETRKQWEPMFEDGVVVEGIDLGEEMNLAEAIKEEQEISNSTASKERDMSTSNTSAGSTTRFVSATSSDLSASGGAPRLRRADQAGPNPKLSYGETSDDLLSFLKTVELAGIPSGMSIAAVLGDSDRQKTLAHLRKQMMSSNPSECMLCKSEFHGPADIRFCPGCSMVSCSNCVSMRVFEISTRKVINVCVHCFEESSRIKHPPKDIISSSNTTITPDDLSAGKKKWWTTEELEELENLNNQDVDLESDFNGVNNVNPMLHGLDTSMSVGLSGAISNLGAIDVLVSAASDAPPPVLDQLEEGRESLQDEDRSCEFPKPVLGSGSGDRGVLKSRPLLSGLTNDDEGSIVVDETSKSTTSAFRVLPPTMYRTDHQGEERSTYASDTVDNYSRSGGRAEDKDFEFGDGVGRAVDESDERTLGPVPATSKAQDIANQVKEKKAGEGFARCRDCGDLIDRDVTSIENHERTCRGITGGNRANDAPKFMEAEGSPSKPGFSGVLKGIKNVFGWTSPSPTKDIERGNDSGKDMMNGGEKHKCDLSSSSPTPDYVLDSKQQILEKRFSFHTGSGMSRPDGERGRDLSRSPTRIIYRTARAHRSALFNFRPREVCALQDAFFDDDGSCYVYEVSVRHLEVTGSPGYVTADVLMHAFCAKPYVDEDGSSIEGVSRIAIISQVDTRAKGPGQFFLSIVQGADGSMGVWPTN